MDVFGGYLSGWSYCSLAEATHLQGRGKGNLPDLKVRTFSNKAELFRRAALKKLSTTPIALSSRTGVRWGRLVLHANLHATNGD